MQEFNSSETELRAGVIAKPHELVLKLTQNCAHIKKTTAWHRLLRHPPGGGNDRSFSYAAVHGFVLVF